jgi:hypothetical protein
VLEVLPGEGENSSVLPIERYLEPPCRTMSSDGGFSAAVVVEPQVMTGLELDVRGYAVDLTPEGKSQMRPLVYH